MGIVNRVLDRERVTSLARYRDGGGGNGVDLARRVGPETVVGVVTDSGLRGRGGAGFPTGLKWQTVAAARSETEPTTVVVNASEGEPGTFKDRAILRANPYRMLEGAAIAALAVGADRIRIGIKASFAREIQRLVQAIDEARGAGWFDGLDVRLVLGPDSYLFGEETALLEVVEGRQPFPRITPPFRRGVDEDGTRSAAGVELATPDGAGEAPALVNNVETLANVPTIVTHGSEWFRELGTDRSPGTVVCTISGATRRAGVAEVEMGTTLREAIDLIGWGPTDSRRIGNVLSGTANPILPASLLDTPLTYEAMNQVGAGLGSAGFIVFDDATDPVAIARGVSRFLAVESCGQCEPCKRDGLEIARLLDLAQRSMITEEELADLERRVGTVAIGARCNLARQQQDVVGSLLRLYDDVVVSHVLSGGAAAAPAQPDTVPIVPIAGIVAGHAVLDTAQLAKQPDWSYDELDSGTTPADRLLDTPVFIDSPRVGPAAADPAARGDEAGTPTFPAGDHPLELVDEAHELLDALLWDALHDDGARRPEAVGKLAHLARVHVDATRRVLYPMARRHGGDDMEGLTARAEERGDLLVALTHLLDGADLGDREHVATLHALGAELREHCREEAAMLDVLVHSMDEADQAELAEGLVEARYTSLVA